MLRYAQAFCLLAEELHFGRAAARLNITQPALSHQLKMMERAVGCRLVDRSPHKVALTEAGVGFARELSSAVNQIAAARAAAVEVSRGDAGAIAVGYCELPWSGGLSDIVQLYATRHPGVQVLLKALPTNDQVAGLLSGALDVGFLHPPIPSLGLVLRLAGTEALVAAMSRKHRLANIELRSIGMLASERLIFCSERSAPFLHRKVLDACAHAGFVPILGTAPDSWHAMATEASAGLGVALLPESMSQRFGTDLVFRPVPDIDYVLETALVTRSTPLRPAVARFLEIVDSVR